MSPKVVYGAMARVPANSLDDCDNRATARGFPQWLYRPLTDEFGYDTKTIFNPKGQFRYGVTT
jgi:hypothetical protein